MGWLELQGWLREMGRMANEERGRDQTDPGSWDGYQQDAWWAQQRAKAEQLRGRR